MRERGEGAFRWKRKRAEVRVYFDPPHGRRAFLLTPAITTDGPAEERAALLAGFAARLRASGRVALALPLLERLAGAEGARDIKTICAAIETIIRGEAKPLPPKVPTFGELAAEWTSNRLSERFPDQIPKRDHEDDTYRLEKHILPVIRDVPMADGLFTLDHAQSVLSALSPKLSGATRRHVAHIVHRLVKLAVFPLRLLSADPIPAGWMPLGGARKALSWLYPSEDMQLMACVIPPGTPARKANGAPAPPEGIPLARRVLYGFLAREGMRASEAEALERTDLDLERGVVRLDENKTDDPRAWALRPDVTRALRAWLALREATGDTDPHVFPVTRSRQADRLRRDLELAGINRPELFERTATRQPLRIHDLRASFVTVALALGRSEAWISDRTGHKSHTMIARYQRAARTANELNLGDFSPLDVAIPELRAEPSPAPSGTLGGGAQPDGNGNLPDHEAAPASSNNGAQAGPARSEGSREVAIAAQKPTKQGYSEPLISVARLVVPVVAGSIPVTHPGESTAVFAAEHEPSSEAGPKQTPNPGDPTPAGRGDAVARLAGMLATFATAGDLEGARAMHEAIGRLLGTVAGLGEGAAVVDLEAERKRRAAR